MTTLNEQDLRERELALREKELELRERELRLQEEALKIEKERRVPASQPQPAPTAPTPLSEGQNHATTHSSQNNVRLYVGIAGVILKFFGKLGLKFMAGCAAAIITFVILGALNLAVLHRTNIGGGIFLVLAAFGAGWQLMRRFTDKEAVAKEEAEARAIQEKRMAEELAQAKLKAEGPLLSEDETQELATLLEELNHVNPLFISIAVDTPIGEKCRRADALLHKASDAERMRFFSKFPQLLPRLGYN